jgi:hypothetical protein
MKLNRKNRLLLAAITLSGFAFTAPAAHAANGTWNVDANGIWGLNTNWASSIIANAPSTELISATAPSQVPEAGF